MHVHHVQERTTDVVGDDMANLAACANVKPVSVWLSVCLLLTFFCHRGVCVGVWICACVRVWVCGYVLV